MSATPGERPGAYPKALDLLARRSHFRAELSSKLRARGYPEEEIAAALDRLAAEGYLDDLKTAAELAELRRGRAPEGRRKLAADLSRRGAAGEAIDTVLAARGDEEELAAARDAAARYLRGGRKDAAALARHLDRKGFASGVVFAVLREHDVEPPAEVD